MSALVAMLKPAEAQWLRNFGRLLIQEWASPSLMPTVLDAEEQAEAAIDRAIERCLRGEVVLE